MFGRAREHPKEVMWELGFLVGIGVSQTGNRGNTSGESKQDVGGT